MISLPSNLKIFASSKLCSATVRMLAGSWYWKRSWKNMPHYSWSQKTRFLIWELLMKIFKCSLTTWVKGWALCKEKESQWEDRQLKVWWSNWRQLNRNYASLILICRLFDKNGFHPLMREVCKRGLERLRHSQRIWKKNSQGKKKLSNSLKPLKRNQKMMPKMSLQTLKDSRTITLRCKSW